jgi:phosphoadenosine phosphosulfate reductase
MVHETNNILEVLNNENLDFKGSLEFLSSISGLNVSFSTSFGKEDLVITHQLSLISCENIKIFTLDTGRLFQETYGVWSSTIARYKNIRINAYYPDQDRLSAYVSDNGINAFYESMELRKQCCHIRKVEPLKKALTGVHVWITGLRGETSNGRLNIPKASWDESFQLIKFNPLIDWTLIHVKEYIKEYNIPYNALHDRGFVSIGCAPCTRAVREGEPERAGRWWWENTEARECGLHVQTVVHS